MIFKANCKINVHLKVTGKLPDGYHSLETIFQEIPFCDEIDIETIGEDQILFSSSGINIPGEDPDICIRSAELLKEQCKVKNGCRIHLQKNIPVGAGLGGGSSDAAAVLKALNGLWECGLSTKELKDISVELGADVPFFIEGGCAYGEGKGELLNKIDPVLHNGYILLIYPEIHISTPEAYRKLNLNLTNNANNGIFATLLKSGADLYVIKDMLINDFEAAVFKEHSEIGEIKKMLIKSGAVIAAMSGSGSTVFGFFKNKNVIEELKSRLNSNYFVKAVKV